MKKLSDILQVKGTNVFTIGPRATLADVVSAMVEHNCGSLVVCELDQVVGSSPNAIFCVPVPPRIVRCQTCVSRSG